MARVIPLLLGIAGNSLLIKSMSAPTDVSLGLVVKAAERFALACFIILLIEALPLWIRRNNRNLAQFLGWIDDQRALPASVPHISAPGNAQRPKNLIRHSNVLFFVLAALVSRFVWLNSASNIFRPPIIALWVLSAVLWALAFAGVGWSGISGFGNAVARDWTVPLRKYWWAFVAFAIIMILGISFRLTRLDAVPAELANDTYLTIVDAFDFAQGTETPVYFGYNNGRPPLTLYLAAAVATLPGFEFDQYALKLSTVLASLASIPIMFWLGYEFMGARRRNVAIVFGLLLSGFVAVSFWEVVVTRGGSTHSLSPLSVALLAVFLFRGIRQNRRLDFILAGLVLGFSLYTYHQARLYPLAVLATILTTMLVKRMTTRERLRMFVNLAILAFIAFMIFLPMFHYMLESPDNFWLRARQLAAPEHVLRNTASEQQQYYVSTFMRNIKHHLLMFHSEGDLSWIYNLPGTPALDVMAGALFILGLPAIGLRILKSRDPVFWSLPLLLVIMFIPALLVFEPHQASRASHSRSLSALPLIFLIEAFSLQVIVCQFLPVFKKPTAVFLAALGFTICPGRPPWM